MDIAVNGEEAAVAEGTTVASLLEIREVKMPDMVTVEVNGEIVERTAFEERLLAPGDQVEFLYFMGGGWLGREAVA